MSKQTTTIGFTVTTEYEMEIEPREGFTVAQIVAGLNDGRFEVGEGSEPEVLIVKGWGKGSSVASIWNMGPTADDWKRTGFVRVP